MMGNPSLQIIFKLGPQPSSEFGCNCKGVFFLVQITAIEGVHTKKSSVTFHIFSCHLDVKWSY